MAESRHASKLAKCRYYFRIFIAHLFSNVGLCGLVVGYAVVGAITFESLEAPNELNQRSTIHDYREQCLKDIFHVTENLNALYKYNWTFVIGARLKEFELEVVNAVKKDGFDGKEYSDSELHWSFSGALLYSISIITTIGFGNIAPKTDVGKVVTIFYAVLGIPLMLLFLTNIGDLLARCFKFTYSNLCFCRTPRRTHAAPSPKHQSDPSKSPISKIAEVATLEMCNGDEKNSPTEDSSFSSSPINKPPINSILMVPETTPVVIERVYRDSVDTKDQRVPMYIVLLFVTGYICAWAAVFSLWEKWTFLDGTYFCFVTLTTLGFGDLVPGSDILDTKSGQAKILICCIYVKLGLSIIAMSFNLVHEEVAMKCRNLATNLGLNKSDHDDDEG